MDVSIEEWSYGELFDGDRFGWDSGVRFRVRARAVRVDVRRDMGIEHEGGILGLFIILLFAVVGVEVDTRATLQGREERRRHAWPEPPSQTVQLINVRILHIYPMEIHKTLKRILEEELSFCVNPTRYRATNKRKEKNPRTKGSTERIEIWKRVKLPIYPVRFVHHV